MKNSKLIGLVALVLVGLGIAYFAVLPAPEATVTEAGVSGETDAAAFDAVEGFVLNVENALSERVLGNPSAPIKISEHSSFTCGHCGNFHKNSYRQIKAELIDTGKAYLVFSDFPLNSPALHASMVARCLPDQDRYFDFVQMLFEKQEEWAYDRNYLGYLKKYAAENGLDDDGIKECLNSTELQEGILERMKASQDHWGISSTPSFVVNNRTVINGALPAAEFIRQVNAAVGNSDPAPVSFDEEIFEEDQVQPEDADADVDYDAAVEEEESGADADTDFDALESYQ